MSDVRPAARVHAWIRTYRGVDRRVEAKAIAATGDAVLIDWGERPGRDRGVGVTGRGEAPRGALSDVIAGAGCRRRGRAYRDGLRPDHSPQ